MASKSYKRAAWNIAKSLGYVDIVPDVRERIYRCTTEIEVDNVLTSCRKKMPDD